MFGSLRAEILQHIDQQIANQVLAGDDTNFLVTGVDREGLAHSVRWAARRVRQEAMARIINTVSRRGPRTLR